MEDKKALADDQLEDVSGGVLANNPNGEKKNLIRTLYDAGSELEIGEENGIVKFEKAVSDLFRPKQ